MATVLGNLLAFVVAISILVAVHEFGHYIVGRWVGMKVLRFSIGFGKPLWTMIAGPDRTEYCISAIPLGGYVRFLDSRDGPIPKEDEGRAFNHRPIYSRIVVLLAGPLFNFLFAIVAYWVLFIQGVPTIQPAVGEVEPGSYAAEAGLAYGDRITAVGGEATEGWEATLLAMLDHMIADGRVPLTLENASGSSRLATIIVGDDRKRLTEPGLIFDGLGFKPWQPSAVIGELVEDGAAEGAGLRVGDRITAIDDDPVVSYADLVSAVSNRGNTRVTVKFERDGMSRAVDLVIGVQERDGKQRGLLGVRAPSDFGDFYYLRKYGVVESMVEAVGRTWTSTLFTVRMLAHMVTGEVSIKNISGPISIAQFAGESAQRGISYFLGFLAIVSISLGVLNLLPVPVLDGGQIVYQAIEGLKGSPLSERTQMIGQQFGIFALLLLMSFAFYNDLARNFG
ncbi:MAG: RIP metalloprotease RseP [Proteobacteria bacterium]|nr:RIP metalloprotease RseP [Pseudomonadota bacterium]